MYIKNKYKYLFGDEGFVNNSIFSRQVGFESNYDNRLSGIWSIRNLFSNLLWNIWWKKSKFADWEVYSEQPEQQPSTPPTQTK